MGNCSSLKNCSGYVSDDKLDYDNGNVNIITSSDSWDEIVSDANKNGKLVVVNFSASWCVPCKMIAPIYGELSKKYPSIAFVTVDVDDLTELSSSWDIRATPTFFFLRDGQQMDKLVGANKVELQKRVFMFAESSSQCSEGP